MKRILAALLSFVSIAVCAQANLGFPLQFGGQSPTFTSGVFSGNVTALPGSASPNTLQLGGVDGATNRLQLDSFSGASQISCRRADTSNANKSALALNDIICNINGIGYGATAYSSSSRALFTINAAEAWSDTAQGTYMQWSVTQPATVVTAAYLQLAWTGTTPGLLPGGVGTVDLGSTLFSWKRFYADFTNTGTVGAVTINKSAGRVNIAAAGTSVVVTNANVTAAAHVFCNVANVDTTAKTCQVTPGAGTMTITLGASATAQVAIDFFVVNSD